MNADISSLFYIYKVNVEVWVPALTIAMSKYLNKYKQYS